MLFQGELQGFWDVAWLHIPSARLALPKRDPSTLPAKESNEKSNKEKKDVQEEEKAEQSRDFFFYLLRGCLYMREERILRNYKTTKLLKFQPSKLLLSPFVFFCWYSRAKLCCRKSELRLRAPGGCSRYIIKISGAHFTTVDAFFLPSPSRQRDPKQLQQFFSFSSPPSPRLCCFFASFAFSLPPPRGYQKFHFNYFTIAQILINNIVAPSPGSAFVPFMKKETGTLDTPFLPPSVLRSRLATS